MRIVLACSICFVIFSVGNAQNEVLYQKKYENLNVDTILASPRLVTNYVGCLLNKKPCPPEGKELKKILPEALRTKCGRCWPSQKEGALKVITALYFNYPEHYKALREKWDQTGEYNRRFEEYLRDQKFNVISGSDSDAGEPSQSSSDNISVTQRPTRQGTTSTTRTPPIDDLAVSNRFGNDDSDSDGNSASNSANGYGYENPTSTTLKPKTTKTTQTARPTKVKTRQSQSQSQSQTVTRLVKTSNAPSSPPASSAQESPKRPAPIPQPTSSTSESEPEPLTTENPSATEIPDTTSSDIDPITTESPETESSDSSSNNSTLVVESNTTSTAPVVATPVKGTTIIITKPKLHLLESNKNQVLEIFNRITTKFANTADFIAGMLRAAVPKEINDQTVTPPIPKLPPALQNIVQSHHKKFFQKTIIIQ